MTLIGLWALDPTDRRARAELGDVFLQFDEDGNLTYLIRGDEKDQVMNLRYEVQGGILVTDQPSAPQKERTTFSLRNENELTLAFGGTPYRFQRM